MTERAFYLGAPEDAFFVTHHAPSTASASAVVLVSPFGWEDVASYRARRDWALHLAERGNHVVRFDLPGTGDSAGELGDPDRWPAWQCALRTAADWVRAESGAPRVTALGIGLGGFLAVLAAAEGTVEEAVAWATPSTGKRFLRELAAFGTLEASRIVEGGAPPAPPRESGIEAGGFVVPDGLAAAIGAAELATQTFPKSARLLLLDRDGAGQVDRLAKSLREAGAEVETGAGPGYAEMMASPDLSVTPYGTFRAVDAWLGDADASQARPSRVAVAETLEFPAFTERPVTLEHDGVCCRGIVAEPVDGDAAPLSLVLLNAGSIRRIGPHRLWVETARRWAAAGLPSLRIDIEGIGDADGDGSVYQEVARFHDPHLVGHVSAFLDALPGLGLPERAVLLGLCSGGHWGWQAALVDDRVAGAVMVNTRILEWHEHIDVYRDLHRTRLLVDPTTWRRLLRGEVSLERFTTFAKTMAASLLRRLRGRTSDDTSIFDWQSKKVEDGFTMLRDASRSAHFVFCDGEPLRDELTRAGLLTQPERWPNVVFSPVPGRDHTLNPVWMHPYVEAAFDQAIRAELERVGEERGSPVRTS